VRRFINGLVSEGVERTVSKTVRETVRAVERICRDNARNEDQVMGEKDDSNVATVRQVVSALQVDRSAVCVKKGRIKREAGGFRWAGLAGTFRMAAVGSL
jgi:hypothetical protein